MREIAVLMTAGICAGIFSGVFGLGGGLVIIPFLVLILGYSQYAANGTSLVALLGPVGVLGVWAYYSAGKINGTHIRAGLLIALGMFAGTYVGSKLAIALPETILRRLFCGFLLYTAVRMWFAPR